MRTEARHHLGAQQNQTRKPPETLGGKADRDYAIGQGQRVTDRVADTLSTAVVRLITSDSR
jgi:hypothetical protein